jgi:glycine dehydrogenase subunit 1
VRYLPHTKSDVDAMLRTIGIESLDQLFDSLPEACRRKEALNLPEAKTEWELNAHMSALASSLAVCPEYRVFMGAGSYDHYIPEVVHRLLSRSEFYTAYTPYQPEISQGTLQAVYEYQTLTSRLLGLDVANASMYDGASALAEALLMAIRVNRRKKVLVSRLIHPLYRQVIQTYFAPTDYAVEELPMLADGRTDVAGLTALDEVAGVAIQSPNFLGCIEDIGAISEAVHSDGKTLLIVSFSEPLAYGILKSPGSLGADIACGEGQSFGIPRSFGGPGLGMFAAKSAFMRQMPGRLIGKTTDLEGRPGFVLTLSTREQHIRREKATSNICSNQGLCATAAGMYMAALGGSGIRELAQLNHDKAAYLQSELRKAGVEIPFSSPVFNEFTAKFPQGFEKTYKKLLGKKIVAGLPLADYFPDLGDHYLMCVTETMDKRDMDLLVKEVKS